MTERHLPESVNPTSIDPDWITHWINEARDTSNDDMQELWARLLAGQIKSPGRFTRRTVSLVKLLEPSDARLFAKLCRVSLTQPRTPVVWYDQAMSSVCGLTFDNLSHLQTLGLIQFNPLNGYQWEIGHPKGATEHFEEWCYADQPFRFSVGVGHPSLPPDASVRVGSVLFTEVGTQLSCLVDSEYDETGHRGMIHKFSLMNPASPWPR